MATKKTHDLVVKTGTYEVNGETKNNYLNVGSLMVSEHDGNKSSFILMNRTFNPAGVPNPDNKDSLLISIYPVKEKESF